MSEADSLLAAVLDRPTDDAPRLALADWLDERDQADRARFIRAQVTARDRDVPGVGSLRVRTGLWHKMVDLEPWALIRDRVTVPTVVTLANTGKTRVQFRRGFADRVWVPAGVFAAKAEAVFARHPIVQVKVASPFRDFRWSDEKNRPWEFGHETRALVDRVKRASLDGPDPWDRLGRDKCPTREAAEAALSAVLVEYGRALAGLGPL